MGMLGAWPLFVKIYDFELSVFAITEASDAGPSHRRSRLFRLIIAQISVSSASLPASRSSLLPPPRANGLRSPADSTRRDVSGPRLSHRLIPAGTASLPSPAHLEPLRPLRGSSPSVT